MERRGASALAGTQEPRRRNERHAQQRGRRRVGVRCAPALLLIAAVLRRADPDRGLVLSLTDFDIYAIASTRAPRGTSASRTTATVRQPIREFWRARCATPSMFVVLVAGPLVGARSRSAAALLVERAGSPARKGAASASIFFAPVVTTLVGDARWCCATSTIRATASWTHVPGADRRRPRSTGSATRTGRCRRSSLLNGVEELRLQHADPSSPGSRAIPEELYEAAASRRREARGRSSATSRCPILAPTCLFVSASSR